MTNKIPEKEIIVIENIEAKILSVRGCKVMLDSDLASLYNVTTFHLNEAVKRNSQRFPEDFMFQLNYEEFQVLLRLTSQNAIAKKGRGGRRSFPYVFTEHGVAMLSSILKSERAIQVNIAIMRAFVQMRLLIGTHKELSRQIENLDRKYSKHDAELKVVFNTLRQLMTPVKLSTKRRIGF